jgi:hypothetical protein
MSKIFMNKKQICFYTCYSNEFEEMAKQMSRSLKKFHPEIPHLTNNIETLLGDLPHSIIAYGKYLSFFYETVIQINADMIICQPLDDLFDRDFDIIVAKNNYNSHPFEQDKFTINAGMYVINREDIWDDYLTGLHRSMGEQDQEVLSEMFYSGKYKSKLLDYSDKSFNIGEMEQYSVMRIEDGKIMAGDKVIYIYHAAGSDGKYKQDGKFKWDLLKPEVVTKLQELIS